MRLFSYIIYTWAFFLKTGLKINYVHSINYIHWKYSSFFFIISSTSYQYLFKDLYVMEIRCLSVTSLPCYTNPFSNKWQPYTAHEIVSQGEVSLESETTKHANPGSQLWWLERYLHFLRKKCSMAKSCEQLKSLWLVELTYTYPLQPSFPPVCLFIK